MELSWKSHGILFHTFHGNPDRRKGYILNVMRQSACLVLTQSWLMAMLPSLIARRWVGRQTL